MIRTNSIASQLNTIDFGKKEYEDLTNTRSSKRYNAHVPQTIESKIRELQFKKCECSFYIPGKPDNEDIVYCGCGRPKEMHSEDAIFLYEDTLLTKTELPKKWNPLEHTEDVDDTDFGYINFSETKTTNSKFVRCSHRTEVDKLVNLMLSCWKLRVPDLIISITGGAKNFDLNNNTLNLLRSSLVKTALSTNAWIITGGTNEGIMKEVGEAVRENISALDPNKQIVLLGIANWATIRNSHLMEKKAFGSTNHNPVFEYHSARTPEDNKNPENKLKKKHSALDPNHTHFILVDDQKLNSFGGEINIRTQLESAVSNYSMKMKNKQPRARREVNTEKIPVIVLVIGGGPNTFNTVLESVHNNSPCIFIKNSGRAANVLGNAYAFVRRKEELNKVSKWADRMLYTISNNTDDKELRNLILEQLQINIPEKASEHEMLANVVQETLEYMHLLTVYELEDTEEYVRHSEIDEAILYSILKAKQTNEEKDNLSIIQNQLQLALTWNRIDITRKYILNQSTWGTKFFEKLMYMAISGNRVDFVEAFLDHGLLLSKFLTHRRLLKLYNDIPKNSPFYMCLMRNRRIEEASLPKLFQRYILKRNQFQPNNSTQIYFNFREIGVAIERILQNFFKHRFNSYPLKYVPDDKYLSILQYTDSYGKCRNIKSCMYMVNQFVENINFEAFVDNPENDLVMFSLLSNKPEMAKLFIKVGRTEISNSLIATIIFKSFSRNFAESDYYADLANNFENLAHGMIDKAYEVDEDKAKLLLMREVPEFGNTTCLELAKIADDLKFLGHRSVQELLTKLWFDKLSEDNYKISLGVCVLIPFLAPVLLDYNEKNDLKAEKKQETAEEGANNQVLYNDIREVHSTKAVRTDRRNRIDLTESDKKFNYFQKVYYFVSAPAIKFVYDKISLFLFLILFSYVLLCDFYPMNDNFRLTTTFGTRISFSEIVLIVWALSFLSQKLHALYSTEAKMFLTKLSIFLGSSFNKVETIAGFGFILGMTLRFIPDNHEAYIASRIILCLDIILWFIKIMDTYSIIKELGPKLYMMFNMTMELLMFMFIIVIVMVAFGVSTQSLMYHNVPLDWTLVRNVFFPAFFIIGGEYYTREMIMNESCEPADPNRTITDRYDPSDCPEIIGANVALILYTIYLIFLNILLINLLIAVFGKTYESIEEKSDKIWKKQRYDVIYEYFHKPTLPPPFVFLTFLIYPFKWIARAMKPLCFRNLTPSDNFFSMVFFYLVQRWNNGFRISFETNDQKRQFIIWESQIAEECVEEEKAARFNKEYKLNKNLQKLVYILKDMNITLEKREKNYEYLEKIERALDKVLEEIESDPNPANKAAIKNILKKVLTETMESN